MIRTAVICLSVVVFFSFSKDSPGKRTETFNGKKDTNCFKPGAVWNDEKGNVINAHGGGILFADKTWYWFGEKRGTHASEGINVYSSKDLYHWKYEGLA